MKTPPVSSPTTILDSDVFSSGSPSSNAEDPRVPPSTALCLRDESWGIPQQGRQEDQETGASCCARNPDLSGMRSLSNGDRERERAQGVSTELALFSDPWTIKKQLTKSDIGNLSRLLLLTKCVEDHILPYLRADQVALVRQGGETEVEMFDVDAGSTHRLILKRWVTRSYVLIGNWRREFVKRRNLKEGDEIGVFWDRFSSKLFIRVLSRANPQPLPLQHNQN